MAINYAEAVTLFDSDVLRGKVRVALLELAGEIAAESVATTDHAKRVEFAREVVMNSKSMAEIILPLMVALNLNAANTGSVTGAPDATIKTAASKAIELWSRNAATV